MQITSAMGEVHQHAGGFLNIPADAGDRIRVSAFLRSVRLAINFRNAAGHVATYGVNVNTPAQTVSEEWLAPAGTTYFRVLLQNDEALFPGEPGGYVNNIRVQRDSAADQANADLIALTRADVQQNANGLTAATQQIAAANAAIEGKANASDLAATQLTVQQHGQTLSSHGQTLNGLTASVGGVEASVTDLRQVSASALSGNAVVNPGFELDAGWGAARSGTGALPTGVVIQAANQRSGARSLRFNGTKLGNTGEVNAFNVVRVPARAGQRFRIGAWFRAVLLNPTAQLRVTLAQYDSAGGYIGWSSRSISTGTNVPYQEYGSSPLEGTVTADDSRTSYVGIGVNVVGMDAGGINVDDVFLEPVSESLADVLASYVLAMNAGGKFSGVKYLNDGTVSNATFLFDNFDFETADGRFRISDGRTITRSNGFMRVEGKPFGQNNEMVVWYGPEQSNLANCRRNNAISFETNNGLHYSIGAMFSGTISAGGYTTAIAATRYSTGAFGTNGGPIVVNASFTHSRQQLGGKQQSPNWQKNTISAGSGTTSATIELWRRIGTGSWQLVASATREGVLSIQSFPGEPDVDDVAQWNNTVSLTYTDNAGGTQNREFEVRLIQNTFQGIVISGDAPVPAPTDSRSLGVRTSE